MPGRKKKHLYLMNFRVHPEHPIKDLMLRGDICIRPALRKFWPKAVEIIPANGKKYSTAGAT